MVSTESVPPADARSRQPAVTRRATIGVLAALVLWLLPSRCKAGGGDSGDSAVAVGLWAEFSTRVVPPGIDRIRTSGFGAAGWGSALYTADPDQANASPTAYRRKSRDGRWFRLSRDQPLTLAMFGGVADGRTDNSPAFAAAFEFDARDLQVPAADTPYRMIVDNRGPEYSLQVPAEIAIDARGATLRLDATGLPVAFRYAFYLDGCRAFHWRGGRIDRTHADAGHFLGGGQAAGRVRIEGVTDCSRGMLFFATRLDQGSDRVVTGVDIATGAFTVPGHGLSRGELIVPYRPDNGVLHVGLETHRDYYAIPISGTTFRVAETEALARSGSAVTLRSGGGGRPPTRIRVGVVPSGTLEIIDCRCENAGAGPHVFGMWKHTTIRNLSGYTQSVQLFQFERPGGGNWISWGFPFVSDVADVRVEASGLGGVEWTHCHEIRAKNIRVEKPNRWIDGTLRGMKPESPDEPTDYAGVSIGARTRSLFLADIQVRGAPILTNDGPRAAWPTARPTPGIRLVQPAGTVVLDGIGGEDNARCDLEIVQYAGDGYTNFMRRDDSIVLRNTRLRSRTPILTSAPHSLPPIDGDASLDTAMLRSGQSGPRSLLSTSALVGADGRRLAWFNLGGGVSVDSADTPSGAGSIRYHGGDPFNFVRIPLGDRPATPGYVHVFALVKFNASKYRAAPNFFLLWDDDAAVQYPFQNATIGEFTTGNWVVLHTVIPDSATTRTIRIYPHFAQPAPIVRDPDWYVKIDGVWIWATPNWMRLPKPDIPPLA